MKKILLGFSLLVALGLGVFFFQDRADEKSPPANGNDVRALPGEGIQVRDVVSESAPMEGKREVAAQPSRGPKSNPGLDEFLAKSEARWSVKRTKGGAVARLSEGSFPLGTRAAVVGAERFLKEYSKGLFGVEANQLTLDKNLQEDHGSQLVYEQQIDGVPVFGSRLSLFVDREGNLVHAISDLYSGSIPQRSQIMNSKDSASLVRAALVEWIENEYGMIDPQSYPVSEVESVGVLGYRLQRGKITYVYRYELVLQGDHHGNFEAMVDANNRQLVLFRDLNRK